MKAKYKLSKYFSDDQIQKLHNYISNADSNEILFGLKIQIEDEENFSVLEIETIYFGNQNSVIADYETISNYDFIMHNHPNNILHPSDADMKVAYFCKENGIGFSIIGNNLDYIYFVIHPINIRIRNDIDFEDIKNIFQKNLPKYIDNFQERDHQIKMSLCISDTINKDVCSLIEAGTGIGKSFAYGIPSALYSSINNLRVVITTNTIALQQQLIEKDLPVIEKILNKKLKYSLLLGRNNYICQYRFELFKNEYADTLFGDTYQNDIDSLEKWLEQTQSGIKSDLSYEPDYEIWREICCQSGLCLNLKCKHYRNCFYFKARKNLTESNIIVLNHHLYLSNALLTEETVIIPPHSTVIFDEAHNLEDVLEKIGSSKFSLNKLIKQLEYYIKSGSKGYFTYINKMVGNRIEYNLDDFKKVLIEQEAFYNNIFEKLSKIINENLKFKEINYDDLLQSDIKKDFFSYIVDLSSNLKYLSDTFLDVLDNIKKVDGLIDNNDNVLYIYKNLMKMYEDIMNYNSIINQFLNKEDVSEVLWLNYNVNDICFNYFNFESKREIMKSIVSRTDSQIFTSATLTTARNFSYFKKQLGIFYKDFKTIERKYKSPFDYKSNVFFSSFTDLPYPNESEYISFIGDKIEKLIRLNNGNAFVLTTSYRDLNLLQTYLNTCFDNENITIFYQGSGIPRKKLIENFKKTKNSVLLGTSTFWEGVDIPGDSLSLLIITKLPFKVPTSPIFKMKSKLIEDSGRSSFFDLSLPNSILKLKQGFGRLIRNENDKGGFFILDKRIATKSYGKTFLSSLPDMKFNFENYEEISQKYNKFMENSYEKNL